MDNTVRTATPRGFLRTAMLGVAMVTAYLMPHHACAQVTFDVIGPHEYDLPVNYQPWNVFVQYATFQNANEAWDSGGHRQDLDPGYHSTVGLSKWVHFFTLQGAPNVGMGFEVIQPEVSIRTNSKGAANASTSSGFGDSIIGYAIWYKPTEGSTLGFQTFLQMPVGARDVSDTNWKNLSSALWYVPLGESFGWTGDAGWVAQSTRDDGVHPGFTFNTNNRFGWKVNKTFEPFLALDYEHVNSSSQRNGPELPSGHTLDGGAGVMANFFAAQSISLRYSHSLDGANHGLTNEIALKYVLVF